MDYIENRLQRGEMLALLGIISLACVLRIWGVSYGLPYAYILDETFAVNHSLAFGTGDLNPHIFEWPGSLLFYVLFLVYGLYYILGYAVGWFDSANDFALSFLTDPSAFYLIGRVLTVAISTATVYALYYVGRQLYSRKAGLIAALFLACAPLVCGVAHFTLTDTPLALFCVLAFVSMHKIVTTGKLNYYAMSGLIVGLGASIKYNALALVVPLLTAHLLWLWQSKAGLVRSVFHKGAGLSLLFIVLGFVIGCPFSIVDTSTFYNDLCHQLSRIHATGNINAEYSSPFLYYIEVALVDGVGLGVSLICLAGSVWALYRHRRADILVLSFVVVYYAYLSSWKVAIDKYLLPIIPLIILLGGSALADLASKVGANKACRRSVILLVCLLVVVGPTLRAIRTDIGLTRKDTRTSAKQWIEANVPAGTAIAIDAGRIDIAKLSPPLNDEPNNLYATYVTGGEYSDNKHIQAGKSILTKYYELRRKVPAQTTYALTRIVISSDGQCDKNVSLEKFRDKGIRYIVVSSFAYEGYRSVMYGQNHPEAAQYYRSFYQSVNDRCKLVKEFSAEPAVREGPTIKIYRMAGVVEGS